MFAQSSNEPFLIKLRAAFSFPDCSNSVIGRSHNTTCDVAIHWVPSHHHWPSSENWPIATAVCAWPPCVKRFARETANLGMKSLPSRFVAKRIERSPQGSGNQHLDNPGLLLHGSGSKPSLPGIRSHGLIDALVVAACRHASSTGSLTTSPLERRREIGVLRSLGVDEIVLAIITPGVLGPDLLLPRSRRSVR